MAQATQTPAGEMKLSDLRPGQLSEQDIARQQLQAGGVTAPSAGDILAQIEKNKLNFQRQQQDIHTQGAVSQMQQTLPLQTQAHVAQTAATLPLQTQAHVAQAQQTAPILTQQRKEIAEHEQKKRAEPQMKPTPAWLNSIDKQMEALQGRVDLGMGSEQDVAELNRLSTMRSTILQKASEAMGVPTSATPQPAKAPTAPPGKGKPSPTDLAQYRTIMQSGNSALMGVAKAKAMKAWGYLP
jgi:hypothetical protein